MHHVISAAGAFAAGAVTSLVCRIDQCVVGHLAAWRVTVTRHPLVMAAAATLLGAYCVKTIAEISSVPENAHHLFWPVMGMYAAGAIIGGGAITAVEVRKAAETEEDPYDDFLFHVARGIVAHPNPNALAGPHPDDTGYGSGEGDYSSPEDN